MSVTNVSCAKTVEMIKMPSRVLTRGAQNNHVSGAGPDDPMGRGTYSLGGWSNAVSSYKYTLATRYYYATEVNTLHGNKNLYIITAVHC